MCGDVVSFNFFPSPTPLFPKLAQGWSVKRTILPPPALVIRSVSGKERAWGVAAYPVREFEVIFELLRDQTQNTIPFSGLVGFAEVQILQGLYLACLGSFGEFDYDDPSDDSRFGAPLGVGDGSTRVFIAQRSWGVGALAFPEPVGDIASVGAVYDNGTPVAGISFSGNRITLPSAPAVGHVLTWDGSYYFRCRFSDEPQAFDQFFKNWWTTTIKFRSVKP